MPVLISVQRLDILPLEWNSVTNAVGCLIVSSYHRLMYSRVW